ncbi:MAG: hypothetical protein SV760_05065 [Halobacteria archaeon]|nr:hypothetical protein [Halobacteria archaeon]
MNCPGCSEEIYEEELIDGSCPLCGKQVEEDEESFDGEETINEIIEFFENQSETMAINIDQRTEQEREFTLHLPASLLDRLKPKKCETCGRWHIKVGDKRYDVRVEGDEGEVDVSYLCSLCSPDD